MYDYDPETQGAIRKIMFDQHQKRLGKPTSDEMKNEDMLRAAWDAEGSPFKGQPFDPSMVNMGGGGGAGGGGGGALSVGQKLDTLGTKLGSQLGSKLGSLRGKRSPKGETGCYAVSFGADNAMEMDSGRHGEGGAGLDDLPLGDLLSGELISGDLLSGDLGDLIEMTDVLVDEATPTPAKPPVAARVGATVGAMVGGTSQGCTYEELGEQTLSDCSADDFEMLFEMNQPPKPPEARSASKPFGKAFPRAASGKKDSSRAVEKRSLLTDVDVLVS